MAAGPAECRPHPPEDRVVLEYGGIDGWHGIPRIEAELGIRNEELGIENSEFGIRNSELSIEN
jgi:hypothetical protein